jgi:hypothetical protein
LKQKVIGKETQKKNLSKVDENPEGDLYKYEALDESAKNDKKILTKEFKNEEPRRIWTAQGAVLIDSKGKVLSENDQ